jgi:galactonate dehydratase
VHLCATLPNFLILEHLEDDVPQRFEVMQPQPTIVNGYMKVPTAPGLGIDIVEDAIVHYPSTGNVAPPAMSEYTYFRAREERAAWLQSGRPRRTEDFV